MIESSVRRTIGSPGSLVNFIVTLVIVLCSKAKLSCLLISCVMMTSLALDLYTQSKNLCHLFYEKSQSTEVLAVPNQTCWDRDSQPPLAPCMFQNE